MGQWDVLPWGLSHSHNNPHPTAGLTWLPGLTPVTLTGTSHPALSQELFPALTLQSPLFVCPDKTKLSPSQPLLMPIKCCSALAGPFKPQHHTKHEPTPSSPRGSKCGSHQRRPQIVKNDPNLIQGHTSGLLWGLFVVQCQCKATANSVFPQRSTSWESHIFSTWNDQEPSPHQSQSVSCAAK